MPQRFIFTKAAVAALRANAKLPEDKRPPVVKVFNPYGGQTWLLSELYEDGDTLFGLCDLGQGFAELGTVSKAALESIRINMGGAKLPLERDKYFTPTHTMEAYVAAAGGRRITEDTKLLDQAMARASLGKV